MSTPHNHDDYDKLQSRLSQISNKALIEDELTTFTDKIFDRVLSLDHEKNVNDDDNNDLDEQKNDVILKMYIEIADVYILIIKNYSIYHGFVTKIKKRLEGILDRIDVLRNKQQQRSNKQLKLVFVTTSNYNEGLLSNEEKGVLKQSSLIASGLFLPFAHQDAININSEYRRAAAVGNNDFKKYMDPMGVLPLSSVQQQKLYTWGRPEDIIQYQRYGSKCRIVMMKTISPYTIRQSCVTDCSFVASLCICAAYEMKFSKRSLLSSIIYPQDDNGIPVVSPTGKYLVKLWFNGVARSVLVDDLFPIDRNGRLLCSHTTNKSSVFELWVPIIEKAYLKLCGGYDFPGSNSGVDLFSLTGWIPERIHFPENKYSSNIKDHETPIERVWERLSSAVHYGDCLITASSSPSLTTEQADAVGLVVAHAYAVLAVTTVQSSGLRLLQMKNPWGHKSWCGKYSRFDTASWTVELQNEVGYNLNLASKADDGVFWICWEDLVRYFSNIFLSWNPSLFSSRVYCHARWFKDEGPYNDSFNIGENPQYKLYALFGNNKHRKNHSLWVLITRHVARQEQEGAEPEDYLAVHLYKSIGGQQIQWYPDKQSRLLTGAYTNDPHNLVRFDDSGIGSSDVPSEYRLILSQYKKKKNVNYTLSCYSTAIKLKLERIFLPVNKHEIIFSNSATTGCHLWNLEIPPNGSKVSLTLSVPQNVVVQISMKQSAGGQNRDLIGSDVRQGFVAIDTMSLSTGKYLIIAQVPSKKNENNITCLMYIYHSCSYIKVSKIS